MLHTLFSFLIALGVLVVIHEWGHYAVARFFGVRVIRFSVGFGKTLWVKRFHPEGTEWAIAMVPLGGFVRMVDERDPESMQAPNIRPEQCFNRKPVGQRMAIVLAGPMMNLFLAVLLYGAVYLIGMEEPQAKLAAPESATLAAEVGIRGGDEVIAINGDAITGWAQLNWAVLNHVMAKEPILLTLRRDGHSGPALREVNLSPEHPRWPALGGGSTTELGLIPYESSVKVRLVQAGGAGDKAGLKVGDVIQAVDDEPVASSQALTSLIRRSAGKTLTMTVLRQTGGQMPEVLRLTVIPESIPASSGKTVLGRIAVGLGGDIARQRTQGNLMESIVYGFHHTVEVSTFSLSAFANMLTGDLSFRMLSGPLTIADAAGQSAKIGLTAFLAFLAMVSVSLGVLNLLPIPVLDGGHLLYHAAEFLRGRPLPDVWYEWGQRLGLVMIAALTALALANDIQRYF